MFICVYHSICNHMFAREKIKFCWLYDFSYWLSFTLSLPLPLPLPLLLLLPFSIFILLELGIKLTKDNFEGAIKEIVSQFSWTYLTFYYFYYYHNINFNAFKIFGITFQISFTLLEYLRTLRIYFFISPPIIGKCEKYVNSIICWKI